MRLRQWGFERTALRQVNTSHLKSSGWRERRVREADSRNGGVGLNERVR